jgi:hypothetical protein
MSGLSPVIRIKADYAKCRDRLRAVFLLTSALPMRKIAKSLASRQCQKLEARIR